MNYRCRICERDIDEATGIAHVKAEEYLLELIRKNHPEWKKGDTACSKCIEYYRKLVKENKI